MAGLFFTTSFFSFEIIYKTQNTTNKIKELSEDGLVLALVAEVPREALAEAVGVIADTTAGAVAALLVTVAEEHIGARGALFERAVRSAEAQVAHAAHVLHGVPRRVVGLAGLNSELLLRIADTPAGAVVRAHRTLARDTVVVLEAFALAGLAVANTLVGALNLGVGIIRRDGNGHPGSSFRASTRRAITLRKGEVTVWPEVARALVVSRARTVSGAPILLT